MPDLIVVTETQGAILFCQDNLSVQSGLVPGTWRIIDAITLSAAHPLPAMPS